MNQILVTPEQYIALKESEQQARTRSLDGQFDEGFWLERVRMILGDEVILSGGGEIVVDWKRHSNKKQRLQAAGWRVGSVSDFLGLTPEEEAYIEGKLTLSRDSVR